MAQINVSRKQNQIVATSMPQENTNKTAAISSLYIDKNEMKSISSPKNSS
jgi:hypothetical protein